MRSRHARFTIVLGRNSLRKNGLIQFLRSADFGTVTSVTSPDDLCTSRIRPGQVLYVLVHTGDDFEAAVEQIKSLKNRHPDGRVVMVADRYRLDESTAAFRAGANGYFVDVTSPDVFIKSIELVMMGEAVFPPAFLPFADPKREHDNPKREHNNDGNDAPNGVAVTPDKQIAPQLSPREKSILRCLVEGDSNKRIARKIDIAEATVKVHIKAILRKIGLQNRTQAAIWGMTKGWIEPREDTNSSPLAPKLTKRILHPVEVMAEMEQSDALLLPNVIENRASHPERPRHNGPIYEDGRFRR